jgi:hypothetical protein
LDGSKWRDSVSYQQVTVTVIVKEEDVESVKREFNITLDAIGDDYTVHQDRVISEECEDPETEDLDLYEYEDAA